MFFHGTSVSLFFLTGEISPKKEIQNSKKKSDFESFQSHQKWGGEK